MQTSSETQMIALCQKEYVAQLKGDISPENCYFIHLSANIDDSMFDHLPVSGSGLWWQILISGVPGMNPANCLLLVDSRVKKWR